MKTKTIYVGYRATPTTCFGVTRLTLKRPLEKDEAEEKAIKGLFSQADFEENLQEVFDNLLRVKQIYYAYFVRKKDARKWSERYAYR